MGSQCSGTRARSYLHHTAGTGEGPVILKRETSMDKNPLLLKKLI